MFATTGELLLGILIGSLLALLFAGLLLLLIKVSGNSLGSSLSVIIMFLAFILLQVTDINLVGSFMEYRRNEKVLMQINNLGNGVIDQITANETVKYLAEKYLPDGSESLNGLTSIVKDPVSRIKSRMLSRIWWKVIWSMAIVALGFIAIILTSGAGGARRRSYSSSGNSYDANFDDF